MKHSYPQDLVEVILRVWETSSETDGFHHSARLPERENLEHLISTCYQVSMMTEEARAHRFRIMLCDPAEFPADVGPPQGHLRCVFREPRVFDEYEMLKLSPASEFESSLIGVRHDSAEGLRIWGLINSGTRWIQAFRGGSKTVNPMPDSLVLEITGPGSIRASRGSRMLAQLSMGRVIMPHANVLYSRWVAQRTASFHNDIMEAHRRHKSHAGEIWATVNQALSSRLYEQVIKRVISSIRNRKHGGTIFIFPPSLIEMISSPNPHIFMKYVFQDEEPMRRLPSLIVGIMNELAKYYGKCGNAERVVGWSEYVACNHETLRELDEALFEYARFVANLTTVDGAVVFAKGLELVGFGGVVKGAFGKEDLIARALDLEGEARLHEHAEGVGTRHLAAYHLCREVEDVLAIVISQDGNTRLIRWMNGYVTYWDIQPMTIAGVKAEEGA